LGRLGVCALIAKAVWAAGYNNDALGLIFIGPVFMIVMGPAMLALWFAVTIRAKLYRIAAEDARDLADELGLIELHEDE
jgi:hypothetical protein